MARSGIWSSDDHQIGLPAIAFIHNDRISAPDTAELLLSKNEVISSKLTLVDRGSVFLPSDERGEITISPDLPYPLSLGEMEYPEGEEKTGAVVVQKGDDSILQGSSRKEIQIYVMGNAIEHIRHPKEFVDEVVRLRQAIGYGSMIYLPGIADPSNLAILCYCGGDIFDSTRIIWESRSGHVLSPEGRWPPSDSEAGSFTKILDKNYAALQDELDKTVHHIRNGSLREFVEKRAVHDPWMIAALRHFDLVHYDHQELHFSVTGPNFHANTKESLHRPDVIRFRKRVRERYRKPESAKILLLLPCSAKKPYSMSRSHSLFRKALKDSGVQHLVHEVMITSPLGIVPRELEIFFPAQNYDIPVTGHWSKDEISIVHEDLQDFLEKNKYDYIVAHLGSEKDFVCEVLDDLVSTSEGAPTSPKDLSRLTKELSGLEDQRHKVSKGQRQAEDMMSRCVYQFGNGGEVLMESAEIKGRYPNLKIFSNGIQMGMLVQERGMISLTLDGAERISQKDLYCVQIDDFRPEGNLFAVGVEGADEELRIGDDAIIRYEKDVRAVGSAVMNWKEMTESARGEAVRIRHRKKA
ncbi:MAG: archaeosine synthase subunit alpha [Thermoplasmata archaeon]